MLLFFLIACSHLTVFSQNDYRQDSSFFNAQIPTYRSWLDRQQLASYFEFEEPPVTIRRERVILNLLFRVAGIDASINAIRQLNQQYQQQTGFSLEEALFQKAVHLFEVPPEDLNIKVESIPEGMGPPGVASRLRYRKNFADDTFYITPFSTLRSEVKDSVVIQDFELPGDLLLPLAVEVPDRDYRQKEREICNYIKKSAEDYFGTRGEFYASFPVATNTVNFEVKNLKHEVVEPGILKLLDPHEKLTFTVKVLNDGRGGLKVFTIIDGKYGPGLYRPRSKDYHEMDPRFKEALEAYTERFAREKIRNWIIKP